ncbi:MAG TPA: RNA polymerase subunit sigma-70 [Leptospiraceae bacterium]|nr:RNA polymerase subunit sigma-70 [Spirochaetaceae bacterium]HBS05249.1 RNA polymerase subunit sigma-70 [Leptospiraceae bacterium]
MSAREIQSLVKRCGDKDPDALKEFFRLYSSDIYNFPLRVFHLDEDAASDFYLYAFERLKTGQRFKSFQGKSSFRTWFYTVLRNMLIDWMRTVHEVKTVEKQKSDEDSRNLQWIETVADPETERPDDSSFMEHFHDILGQLPRDLNMVFKLVFIYYLDLEQDDWDYLKAETGAELTDIARRIAEQKNELAERSTGNQDQQDKITSLYLSILELKTKKSRLLAEMETRNVDPGEGAELDRIEHLIEKKQNQRDRLIQKRKKGHFVVRAPYRFVSDVLEIPEGSVSVMMSRIMDAFRMDPEIRKAILE